MATRLAIPWPTSLEMFLALSLILWNMQLIMAATQTRIAVTGDSAGGHLSAVAGTMPNKIGDGGFGETEGVFEFMPSYIPKNKTLDQVREEMMAAIKAAAPSYGVFGSDILNHYSEDPKANDTWKEAIAPLSNIPNAEERAIPHYLTRGTKDGLITDEAV